MQARSENRGSPQVPHQHGRILATDHRQPTNIPAQNTGERIINQLIRICYLHRRTTRLQHTALPARITTQCPHQITTRNKTNQTILIIDQRKRLVACDGSRRAGNAGRQLGEPSWLPGSRLDQSP